MSDIAFRPYTVRAQGRLQTPTSTFAVVESAAATAVSRIAILKQSTNLDMTYSARCTVDRRKT